ncbi:MAG: hypothetical protein ACOYL5_04445 [Phototrophicaceae bacterium]|jgi:hypothetical protein
MSLLQRQLNSQNQNQNPPNQNQQGSSPFGSRPASPFGRPAAKPAAPANANEEPKDLQLVNVIIPPQRVVVRFDLNGLGDPFYRLMGKPMNSEFSQLHPLAQTLERGGEPVEALRALLNEVWAGYSLRGAALVYNTSFNVNRAMAEAFPMPGNVAQNPPKKDDDDDTPAWLGNNNPNNRRQPVVERWRAIDLALTLNVLARARTQVVLMGAPLVFGTNYLTRSLVTDDPRLVALAKASGALADAL